MDCMVVHKKFISSLKTQCTEEILQFIVQDTISMFGVSKPARGGLQFPKFPKTNSLPLKLWDFGEGGRLPATQNPRLSSSHQYVLSSLSFAFIYQHLWTVNSGLDGFCYNPSQKYSKKK